MNTRAFVWIGIFVGSTIGSFVPLLWGGDLISYSSIIFSGIGALAGIWLAYKLSH